jgi:predicted transcriptional regulator
MNRTSVVTSIKVDEDLWKKAKKRAVDDEITLQELINSAVEAWLKGRSPAERRRKH